MKEIAAEPVEKQRKPSAARLRPLVQPGLDGQDVDLNMREVEAELSRYHTQSQMGAEFYLDSKRPNDSGLLDVPAVESILSWLSYRDHGK